VRTASLGEDLGEEGSERARDDVESIHDVAQDTVKAETGKMDDSYYTLKRSTRPGKKWMVRVPTSSGRGKVVHFGDSSMQDFTQHKDTDRRERYWNRHQRDNLDDPGSPGFWSWHALWGQSSNLKTAFAAAVRKAKKLGGARRNPSVLHERFDELSDMISSNAALVIDEEAALAGRDPDSPRAFAATDGYVVYVRPKLAEQTVERIDGVLMHELGHVILIQHGYPEHTERECDACAEGAFNTTICYDADDVQTTGLGVHPRPAYLDVRHNPGSGCCC